MSGIHGAVEFAGKHPVGTAVGVFAVGALLLLMFRGGGSAPASDGGMSAFYAAQAASNASGNQLAAVQEQGKAATAIAQIGANRDMHLGDTAAATSIAVNTVQAQTDVQLAGINASVLSQAELTRQQAQKQQFFLSVGIQQLLGQSMPFLIDLMRHGGTGADAAASVWQTQVAGGTAYSSAH